MFVRLTVCLTLMDAETHHPIAMKFVQVVEGMPAEVFVTDVQSDHLTLNQRRCWNQHNYFIKNTSLINMCVIVVVFIFFCQR